MCVNILVLRLIIIFSQKGVHAAGASFGSLVGSRGLYLVGIWYIQQSIPLRQMGETKGENQKFGMGHTGSQQMSENLEILQWLRSV